MIVVYSANDPDYPGIHIELAKDGISYILNLSTIEYKMEEGEYVTHVWDDASKEDMTHDIWHKNVSGYFQNEE